MLSRKHVKNNTFFIFIHLLLLLFFTPFRVKRFRLSCVWKSQQSAYRLFRNIIRYRVSFCLSLFLFSQKHFLLRARRLCTLFHSVYQAWPIFSKTWHNNVQFVTFFFFSFLKARTNQVWTELICRDASCVSAYESRLCVFVCVWPCTREDDAGKGGELVAKVKSCALECVTQRCCCLCQSSICITGRERGVTGRKERKRQTRRVLVHVCSEMQKEQ